ncbi:MAG: TetM/TetW/TetO/TetS family tetracycline resistance ribosomal protection protein [Gammaproteobacteria bacterium]|nr:TetM/TetW/TetO/TetS family tetracycline resistance ribosomal protection protein [Gammaproteobacteria bacterium]
MPTETIRNIGIMAHVDAGKTTLTEQLLYASGVIRRPGRVDHGTSLTDSLEVEKKRGITVRAAAVALNWKETNIRIIDTPGHADFYPEVERSLRALDGAVLVVSSVEGVQLQTLAIWTALRELGIPTLIFVNKLDRVGSEPHKLVEAMRQQLSTSILPIQAVVRDERETPGLIPICDHQQTLVTALECLAQQDEQMMHRYVHDEHINQDEIDRLMLRLARQAKVFPVFFGVALTGLGIAEVLDGIINYLPGPGGSSTNPLSALVFKVESGNVEGRMVHVRVFEGSLRQRLEIYNETTATQEKATRILKLAQGSDYENTATLEAGDIGVLLGLKDSKVGHVLGNSYAIPDLATPVEPMLTAKIFPKQSGAWNKLLEALQQLEDEDPLLKVEWLEEQREIQLRFFGEVQMEIICTMLSSRFNLAADFSEPCVIYKETPARVGEAGIKFRDGGYADLELRIEPLPTGSGFEYESLISGDTLVSG